MHKRTAFLLALLIAVIVQKTSAQELESLAGVRLNVDRTDARGLGMGATGVALRGAGAVRINPAAMAGTPRTLSIEGASRTMEGRYYSDAELHTTGIDSTTRGISSVSLTMPVNGLTWSLFYDEPIDVDHSTAAAFTSPETAALFVCGGRVSAGVCNGVPVAFNLPATYPIEAQLRLKRYGVGAAWSRGPWAFGGSVQREVLRQRTAFTAPADVASYSAAETTDDADLTWTAGGTWQLSSRATLGATYSSGGAFAGSRTFPEFDSTAVEFRTPPAYGAGLAIDVLPNLTVTADAMRVQYSAMMHDRRGLFPQGSELGYSDATELHAGAELRTGKLALRAGYWRDPAHGLSIRNGVQPPLPLHYAAAIVDADENHVTAGLGYGTRPRLETVIDRGKHSTKLLFGVSTVF